MLVLSHIVVNIGDMAIGASKGVSYIGMIGNEHIPKTAAHVDHTMIRDTAYSSVHATA